MNMPTRDPEPTWNPAYNQNPPLFDKDLVTRSSLVCGGGKLKGDDYNLGLHVMALFVVLTQSTLACAFPLIARKFRWLRIPPTFLFYARHFGTGVLIATAFVHLLPTAFISLNDPCLPKIWNQDYPAMPGAIAMAAVFFVTIVEMIFARGHMCGGNLAGPAVDVEKGTGNCKRTRGTDCIPEEEPYDESAIGGVEQAGFGMVGNRRSRSHSMSRGLRALAEQQAQSYGEKDLNLNTNNNMVPSTLMIESPEDGPVILTPEQIHKKSLLQCLLLELGILFHSVFIGMALSVTGGPEFLVLLLAIVFHQTFEGLALGSRIAVLKWKPGKKQPWLMALAYGLTTPIGQAIGIATHTLYTPESQTGLLMVGIMNSISSGLLVFAGLVELLAEDFLSDESWRELRGKKRIVACLFVGLGAIGMATVGAWA
ncbi:Zinc/iron permease [Terfezia boudieri ATCC MYA-4762]|uniref:Zinc/iron permease n=1 Tax=Terfezia boudieri ATCC MYA-4762 TaxID=1051890 RepID=A0A3N4LKJ0_9PEZI|nr:Zinc/iron permease [Terfezia boudieri ATCC MYA-4762]